MPAKPVLILASASPRRRQMLRQAGYRFRVAPSRYDEGKPHGRAEVFAKKSALAKAAEVAARLEKGSSAPAVVLAADTLVVCRGEIFGKARSRQEAGRMLGCLSGREHKVVTGVAIRGLTGKPIAAWVETTRVLMRHLRPAEVKVYLDSGQWRGKAGAYGIQDRAGAFVTRVHGCYYNVVGLPLAKVTAVLARLGFRAS